MGDWYLMLTLGTLGLAMRYGGWPRAPLVLGFILGDIMETALDITLQSYTWDWMLRPISAVIAALAVLTVVLAATGFIKRRREHPGASFGEGGDDEPEAPWRPFTSMPFALFVVAMFAYAVWDAQGWPPEAARLILCFGYVGLALAAAVFVIDASGFIRRARSDKGGLIAQYGNALRDAREPRRVLAMYGWFALIVGGTYVMGQVYAIPLFMLLYLVVSARESWKLAAIYALCGWLLLWGMFGEFIHIVWQPPLFDLFEIG
jgi:hypothetical protein